MPGSVDTLTIYEQLKSASLSDEAAKGIANILKSITENNLATKTDVELTKSELKRDIEVTRAELEKIIERTRANIIMWVAGMLVAQTAIMGTLIKLL